MCQPNPESYLVLVPWQIFLIFSQTFYKVKELATLVNNRDFESFIKNDLFFTEKNLQQFKQNVEIAYKTLADNAKNGKLQLDLDLDLFF